MSSGPAALKHQVIAGSGETAVRDPLYVFAVSDWLNSCHDRWSSRFCSLIYVSGMKSWLNKWLMPIDSQEAHMCYVSLISKFISPPTIETDPKSPSIRKPSLFSCNASICHNLFDSSHQLMVLPGPFLAIHLLLLRTWIRDAQVYNKCIHSF